MEERTALDDFRTYRCPRCGIGPVEYRNGAYRCLQKDCLFMDKETLYIVI